MPRGDPRPAETVARLNPYHVSLAANRDPAPYKYAIRSRVD
jgi:hypothetical protein